MRPALLAALLLAAACRRDLAAEGAALTLKYELTSAGALIEASPEGEPLVVTLGSGGLPRAVEDALTGARAGDEKVVELAPEQAFGAYDAAKLKNVPLSKFGAMAAALKPGSSVDGVEGGRPSRGRVVKIENGAVTLDFNHPLAGKALRYRLKVLAVRPAS